MTNDQLPTMLAKLEVRFDNLDRQLTRNEQEMDDRFRELKKEIDDRFKEMQQAIDTLNRLAFLGRVVIGVVMALGAFSGWALAQWQTFKSVMGK